MTTVTELRTDDDRQRGLSVMRDLFPNLTEEQYRTFFEDDEYHLFALDDPEEGIVALAGVSVRPVMHHERHVWVHDLVVDADYRREGHGRRLLDHVEAWARDRDCGLVALATGKDRDIARQFYEEQGYEEWGSVYERRL